MTSALPIYPVYCHALSPTISQYCPLKATDFQALEEASGFRGQDIYFHLNHPIKWVSLTGVITAVDEFAEFTVYTLDDGSGATVEVKYDAPPKSELLISEAAVNSTSSVASAKPFILSTPSEASYQTISPDGGNLALVDIGSVVKFKGGIGTFRGQNQIKLKRSKILRDTNAEVNFWNEVAVFKRDILSKPWVVTPEQEKKCREEHDTEARLRKEEQELKRKKEHRRQMKERRKLTEKDSERSGDAGKGRSDELRRQEKRNGKDGEKRRVEKTKERVKGLDPVNRVNYPSKAVRERVAGTGKYDALGI